MREIKCTKQINYYFHLLKQRQPRLQNNYPIDVIKPDVNQIPQLRDTLLRRKQSERQSQPEPELQQESQQLLHAVNVFDLILKEIPWKTSSISYTNSEGQRVRLLFEPKFTEVIIGDNNRFMNFSLRQRKISKKVVTIIEDHRIWGDFQKNNNGLWLLTDKNTIKKERSQLPVTQYEYADTYQPIDSYADTPERMQHMQQQIITNSLLVHEACQLMKQSVEDISQTALALGEIVKKNGKKQMIQNQKNGKIYTIIVDAVTQNRFSITEKDCEPQESKPNMQVVVSATENLLTLFTRRETQEKSQIAAIKISYHKESKKIFIDDVIVGENDTLDVNSLPKIIDLLELGKSMLDQQN